jgi:hypothetical protein
MIGQKNTYDQVDPKTIWLNIGLIAIVLSLVLAQFMVLFSNQNPQSALANQANKSQNTAQANPSLVGQSEYSKYNVGIAKIRRVADDLVVDYSLVNFDSESGKAFVGFYFDKYTGPDKAFLYYGQTPFQIPLAFTPLEFQKICASVFLPNLDRIETSETCEEFRTSP